MISFAEFRPAPAPAPEIRTDATALAISALTTAVGAQSVQTWAAGAVECAAGLIASALSTADVPEGVPLGASTLADMGRANRPMVSVYLFDVAPRGRCGC